MTRRSFPAKAGVLVTAAAGTAAAATWFATHPSHVLVGTSTIDTLVPVGYQASAFPAFLVLVAALVTDVVGRRELPSRWPAALLVALSTLLALSRLAGAIPLSGHAFFLGAVLSYDLVSRAADELPLIRTLALAGLLVTAWFKVAVWQDTGWFLAAVAAGAAAGGALGAWRRKLVDPS